MSFAEAMEADMGRVPRVDPGDRGRPRGLCIGVPPPVAARLRRGPAVEGRIVRVMPAGVTVASMRSPWDNAVDLRGLEGSVQRETSG